MTQLPGNRPKFRNILPRLVRVYCRQGKQLLDKPFDRNHLDYLGRFHTSLDMHLQVAEGTSSYPFLEEQQMPLRMFSLCLGFVDLPLRGRRHTLDYLGRFHTSLDIHLQVAEGTSSYPFLEEQQMSLRMFSLCLGSVDLPLRGRRHTQKARMLLPQHLHICRNHLVRVSF